MHPTPTLSRSLRRPTAYRHRRYLVSCAAQAWLLIQLLCALLLVMPVQGQERGKKAVYPDLFTNLGKSDEQANLMRLYFSEKTRRFFNQNGFYTFDADTVAAKYNAGEPDHIPTQADYTVTGRFYIFADLLEAAIVITDMSGNRPVKEFAFKTKLIELDDRFEQTLVSAGKAIDDSFVMPKPAFRFFEAVTQDWLRAKYAALFPQSDIKNRPLSDGWKPEGNEPPAYFAEYIRLLLIDALKETNQTFQLRKFEYIESLAVQLYVKYPENAEIIAACGEISLIHKKRFDVAEKFARIGLRVDPFNTAFYLLIMAANGARSGEGREAFAKLTALNPFLDNARFKVKTLNYRSGLYNSYLLQAAVPKIETPDAVETDLEIRYNYALSLLTQNKTAVALEELVRLNSDYPENQEVVLAADRAFSKLNAPNLRKDHLLFLLDALPRMAQPEKVYLSIADLFLGEQNFSLAGKYYEKFYIHDVANAPPALLEKMTLAFIRATEFNKGLFYAKKLVIKLPNSPDGYYYAALSALESGDREQAAKIITIAEQRALIEPRFQKITDKLNETNASLNPTAEKQ